MRLQRFFVTALTAALAASACADQSKLTGLGRVDAVDEGLVRAVVEEPSAEPGHGIMVRFENLTDASYHFNTCVRGTERYLLGEWVLLPEELMMCPAMALVLDAQGSRRDVVHVRADLVPGTYRFTFTMQQPRSSVIVHRVKSSSFEVR